MLWFSAALASSFMFHSLVPTPEVVPALFGEGGAIYVTGLTDANHARLRGSDGATIPVEAAVLHTSFRPAVRLQPVEPILPGSYTVELLAWYTATGEGARFRGAEPVDAAYAVWIPLPVEAAPVGSSVVQPPPPITWALNYNSLEGRLQTPPGSWSSLPWMELELAGHGTVALLPPNPTVRPGLGWPLEGTARLVALDAHGNRAPGPWSTLPTKEPADRYHTTWRTVDHEPPAGAAAKVNSCTLTAGDVLRATDHPPGQLLRDERGVVHAVSVETLQALVVDGVRHDVRPLFERAGALSGSGNDLTVYGEGPTLGVHLKSGEKRSWTGAPRSWSPTQAESVDAIRFSEGIATFSGGWTVERAGTVSQGVQLPGVLALEQGRLVLHSIDADEVWRVRAVGCGPATAPPTKLPIATLQRYDTGLAD